MSADRCEGLEKRRGLDWDLKDTTLNNCDKEPLHKSALTTRRETERKEDRWTGMRWRG